MTDHGPSTYQLAQAERLLSSSLFTAEERWEWMEDFKRADRFRASTLLTNLCIEWKRRDRERLDGVA